MLCPKCEAENSPNARYCGSCGEALGLSCSNCGVGIARAQRFCSECGHAVAGAVAAAAGAGAEALGTPNTYTPPNLAEQFAVVPHAIHGERKQVTVLFCDLVGSTALTEQLGGHGHIN